MVKNHQKRISAPKHWPIKNKEYKFITRTSPGPHPISRSITLSLFIKEILKCAKTQREVKNILYSGKVKVDNIVRRNPGFPIGILDVISIDDTKENYRLFINKDNRFILHKIDHKESNLKPLKIVNKTTLKGKKTQINLSDGRNIIVDKDTYKVQDTLLYDLTKKNPAEYIKLEKGALVYLIGGKQVGTFGIIEEIKQSSQTSKATITFSSGKNKYTTLRSYAYAIGKEKPSISIPTQNEN